MDLNASLASLRNLSTIQINSLRLLFEATAYRNMVSEIVVPIKEKLLLLIKAVDKRSGEPITSHKGIHRMSTEQYRDFVEEYKHDLRSVKQFNRPEYVVHGKCPLGEADGKLLKARKAVADALEPITGLKWADLTMTPPEFDAYFDLTLKYFAQFFHVVGCRAVYVRYEIQCDLKEIWARGIYMGIDAERHGMSVTVYKQGSGRLVCLFQDGSMCDVDPNWVRSFVEVL